MKQRRYRHGLLPFLLGVVFMLAGAVALLATGDGMQYVLSAPAATKEGGELGALYEEAQEQLTSMVDSLTAGAVGARAQSMMIYADGNSVQTVLYAVGEGYFDAVHETLKDGRLISNGDVKSAENVIVLDEKSALTLFPGIEPVGQQVTLEGVAYEVAGVIQGGRRIGEVDEAVAYIPITAASENALPMQTVEITALSASPTSAAILMEDTMTSWKPGGSFYSFSKLRLGAVMPLRWLMLIVGVSVLIALLRRMNAFAMGRLSFYYDRLRTRYVRDMAPGIAASLVICLAGYAALLAAVSALAMFSIEPLYVFTEWVPEVIVEISSLSSRFWSLNDMNAVAVRYVSRTVCLLELGQGFMRWGLMSALLGLALHGWGWLCRYVEMPHLKRER